MTIPTIAMTPVKSSNIAAHGYDTVSHTLAVQFTNGNTYHYHEVPADVAVGMTQAESVGQYFSRTVRGQFAHTAIPKE